MALIQQCDSHSANTNDKKNPKGLSFMSFTRAQNFKGVFFQTLHIIVQSFTNVAESFQLLPIFFRNLMNTKIKKYEKTLGQEPLPFLWFLNV